MIFAFGFGLLKKPAWWLVPLIFAATALNALFQGAGYEKKRAMGAHVLDLQDVVFIALDNLIFCTIAYFVARAIRFAWDKAKGSRPQ